MSVGCPPADFWRTTPRVLALVLDGHAKRERHAHNARMELAWHTASMTRAKRMPKLDKLLVREAPKPTGRRQSPEYLMAMARLWDRAVATPEPARPRRKKG